MIDWAGSTNIQEVLLNLISIKYLDKTKSKDTGPSFSHIHGSILGITFYIFSGKKSTIRVMGGLYSAGQQVLRTF